jgi:hypothetical protein
MSLFLPIEDGRDTEGYRVRAGAFFKEHYGLEVDFTTGHITDSKGNVFNAELRSYSSPPLQVYAADAQSHQDVAGLMPVTNLAVKDDGYIITNPGEALLVTGETPSGSAGIPPGGHISFSESRIMSSEGTIVDTVVTKAMVPSMVTPVPGNSGKMRYSADLYATSKIFGIGQLRAIGEFEGDLHLGPTIGEFQQIARFEEAPVGIPSGTRCNNSKRPKAHTSMGKCQGGLDGASVHSATIYYFFDSPLPSPGTLPPWNMDQRKDTFKFRNECYDFFEQRFGVTLNPTNSGYQFITTDEAAPLPDFSNVVAIVVGQNYNFHAYGVDIQGLDLDGLFPATNLKLNGNGYTVNFIQDTTLTGGTIGTINVSGYGDVLSCIDHDLVADDGAFVANIQERTNYPATAFLVPGLHGTRFLSDFVATSKQLGVGRSMSCNVVDSAKGTVSLRYVMHFNDTFVAHLGCRNYPESKSSKNSKAAKRG